MELTSPKIIKELLAKYETRPNKRMGQNFLLDKIVLDKIIETANLKSTDTVLEVGPGIGTLTQELAKKAENVIAVEKDQTMIKILSETLKDYKNIEVINADILKINLSSLRGKSEATDEAIPTTEIASSPEAPRNDEIKNYKLVANIPYYLTSPLIRLLLESKNPPETIVLLVQKEVAQRIYATPPNMSLLAISVQFYADAKIISTVSKNCFWPAPKVDSSIIKIIPHTRHCEAGEAQRSNLFFSIVKAGFSQPRKQLAGNLSKALKLDKKQVGEWLQKNNINPTQRAETLSVEDWKNLAKSI